ncbi:tyrosine-type recombinase/integrase [uncultured Cohaesibacter sp.]|uniref:tyrosine-type recombinase/integrase n=1 Tax=uncultured Cohaesibacter sp. TaxID=1002546 RepID=UPI002AAC36A0|nr:tyrosine-type recombinase/integrase [uncultured Cohaesibacter sp.]
MKQILTTKSIEALKPAIVNRYEVRDAKVQGLHIRVSTSGTKIFCVFIRQDGKRRRLKIGSYPMVSLADARRKAMELARDAELGVLQPQEASEKQACPTLGDKIPEFIRLYAKPNTKDWKGTQSILSKFDPIARKPLDEIKRTDVVRILDDIVASGTPTRANRALAAIKKLMNWCVDRGVIEISPVAHLRPPTREKSRDRVLSHAEMHTLWHAAISEGYPFKQFVQVLMLTGQRRGEVAGMRWSEVDLDEGIWTLPANRVKNGRLHVVPLSTQAIDILKSIPRFLNSDLVLTTTGKTPISGFGRLKERLALSLPDSTEDWRFHDFRRTVSTEMARLGVQPHVIDAVTNHKSGVVSGVAATYNRYTYLDEKCEALQQWANELERLVAKDALEKNAEKK